MIRARKKDADRRQFHFLILSLFILFFLPLPISVVVQLLSHVLLFATPWTAADQAPLFSLSLRVCSNSCALSQ